MGTDSHCVLQDKPDGQSDSATIRDQVCPEKARYKCSQGYNNVAAGGPEVPAPDSGKSEAFGCQKEAVLLGSETG